MSMRNIQSRSRMDHRELGGLLRGGILVAALVLGLLWLIVGVTSCGGAQAPETRFDGFSYALSARGELHTLAVDGAVASRPASVQVRLDVANGWLTLCLRIPPLYDECWEVMEWAPGAAPVVSSPPVSSLWEDVSGWVAPVVSAVTALLGVL